MPSETCPKHPSLGPYCSCQTSTRGMNLPPRFTMIETEYEGYPVIELLKNGGPIHAHDTHFRFGVRKAEMLLACLDPMKEFAWGSDEERLSFGRRVCQEGPKTIVVTVEFYEAFIWSTGQLIEQPWLRFASPFGYWPRVKGLGVMKSRAIWTLREEIGEWVARNSRPWTSGNQFQIGIED